jgi:hypothetical protein
VALLGRNRASNYSAESAALLADVLLLVDYP